MCKVSVIVPIYNIKHYLPKCIHSLQNQTMEDIEIILVDDGSSDGSSEVCDQFAAKDSRIRVLHKSNEGLSAARNDGIRMSKTDYIMFVDGDDWVESGFCELPYQAAQDNMADIVCFRYNSCFKSGIIVKSDAKGNGLLTKEDISALKSIGINTWSKLYHRKLFDSIHFPVGHVYEDIATTHRILRSADRIYFLDNCLYNYSVSRSGSITGTVKPETLRDYSWAYSLRFHDFECWGIDMSDEQNAAALNFLIKYGRKTDMSGYWEKIIDEKKRLPQTASWRQKVAIKIYQISPILFDMVCVLSKRRIALDTTNY